MQPKEFRIESKPEYELMIPKISPVDILALTTQMDFDKYLQTKTFYNFALEHTQVKVGEKWFPVKYPEREVYMPSEIEEDLTALNEIIEYFLREVIMPAFPKSGE